MNDKATNKIKETLGYPKCMPLDGSAVICIEVNKLIDMMNTYANPNGEPIYTKSEVLDFMSKQHFEITGFSYHSFPKKREWAENLINKEKPVS